MAWSEIHGKIGVQLMRGREAMINEERRKEFEKLGSEKVRLAVDSGRMAGRRAIDANAWLAELDRAKNRKREETHEASIAEQIEISRSAKDAAWESARHARQSNIIALFALLLAGLALIVSAVGLLLG